MALTLASPRVHASVRCTLPVGARARAAPLRCAAARAVVAAAPLRCAAALAPGHAALAGRCSGLATRSRAPQPARAAAGDGNAQDLTVIPGDYRLGAILLGVGAFLGLGCHLGTQGFLHTLLGGFLSFQASRVRFRFSRDELDVVFIEPGAADSTALQASTDSSGDNKLQGGGANKWALSSVTNWEFWWPGFPVLVYYKENQTQASGQPHFFPIIMNGKVLYETMLARMPPSVNPKPSPADWNLDTALEATSIGRAIKAKLEPEQLKLIKELKGIPIVDK